MSRRNAFAFVEVLIIVIVTAALVVTILPELAAPNDVRQSALKFNLHMIRAQIEAYKAEHNGRLPELRKFAEQMTRTTHADGSFSGPNLAYGPYFQGQVPTNPFNNSSAVVAVAIAGREPSGPVPGGAGWQYDQMTGSFWPNHGEYFAEKRRTGR